MPPTAGTNTVYYELECPFCKKPIRSGIGFRVGILRNLTYHVGEKLRWDGPNCRPPVRPASGSIKTIGYFNCDNPRCQTWGDCFPDVQEAIITIYNDVIQHVEATRHKPGQLTFDIIERAGEEKAKVLILGATGYIGSTVAERFTSYGHSVIGLARSSAAASKLEEQGIEPYLGTLDNPLSLLPALSGVEAVVHMADTCDSPEAAPKELYKGRSHLTDILDAMKGSNKLFVFTSSIGVLHGTGSLLYDEDMPLPPSDEPVTLVHRALEAEVLAAANKGVHSIVMRPPVVYGKGGSMLIPRGLLYHARKFGESVYIEGTETNLWSTVHIDDLADLFMLAMGSAPSGSLWHTASESGITTASIATAISRAAGLGGKTRAVSLEKAREIFGDWADFWALNNQSSGQKAMQLLNWQPHRPSMLYDIEFGSYKEPIT